jgi:hypothetical protein
MISASLAALRTAPLKAERGQCQCASYGFSLWINYEKSRSKTVAGHPLNPEKTFVSQKRGG